MKIKICKICQEEFNARGNQSICHQPECKEKAYRINLAKRNQKTYE